MTEYYLGLRHAHIGLAILSVILFVARGGLMMANSSLLQAHAVRILPHIVDTLLLTTALMLATVTRQYPFSTDWVTVKVVLLVVYVALGTIAIRPRRTRGVRIAAFCAALVVVGFLFSVARAHHPLGLFAG